MTQEPLKRAAHRCAFTTAELMVAMAASSIVLAALFIAATSLTRTLKAIDEYSRTQAAQVRLIDSIAMDLRRAVGVSITVARGSNPDSTGNTSTKFAYSATNPSSNRQTIQDGSYDPVRKLVGGSSNPSTYLTLTLPGFYQSNDPAADKFREPNLLVSDRNSVRYGSAAGAAPDVIVQYRKAWVDAYHSECYIRREGGIDKVIAEKAELMDLDIEAQANNSFVVEAWFIPTFNRSATATGAEVTSSDRVMLRNPRKD